jgi:hypothetical protein
MRRTCLKQFRPQLTGNSLVSQPIFVRGVSADRPCSLADETMSSARRYQSTRVVTYSRNSSSRGKSKSPVSQRKQPRESLGEENRSIWEFGDSSDEEEGSERTSVLQHIAVSSSPLKRKAGGDVARDGKKALTNRIEEATAEARQRASTGDSNQRRPQSDGTVTPRKSKLIPSGKNKESQASTTSSRRTSQPPATPPRALTPKTRYDLLPSTPPQPSPQPITTPPKRTFSRVNSSPMSTPRSSGNSVSQLLPTTPSPRKSRAVTRSNTFHEFSSPKLTPKQEKTWEFLPLAESPSPSRRRLVDKLREQVKTPEVIRTSPRDNQPVAPITLEDEISRVLEYTAPVVEEPRRKEPSQAESQGTYLSRARSFLAESQDLGIPGLDELWQPEGIQEQDDDEEDVGVKSWHELKRGGEDKRLLDEMEDLLEESKSGGRLGLRRTSVLQIVDKLFNDVSWRRKFKALGLLSAFTRNVADANSDPVWCLRVDLFRSFCLRHCWRLILFRDRFLLLWLQRCWSSVWLG